MKILIAPDKFKGSLTAHQVCDAITNGILMRHPEATITSLPLADGGDGSLELLSSALDLKPRTVITEDPIGRQIQATYYTSKSEAFIEVSTASGIVLLEKHERNPLFTSTFGTGILIRDAIQNGCKKINLFLGGSATNDAGLGIASALGIQFFDKNSCILEPTGKNLERIQSFDESRTIPGLSVTQLNILVDVNNPLYGPNGAAQVYAPQKGANEETVKYLDQGLRQFASIILRQKNIDVARIKGGGSAGGIAAGLVGLFGASIESGFEMIAKLLKLEDVILSNDLVISGEGKLDEQTLEGKVISGLAALCKKHAKPLHLLVGANQLNQSNSASLQIESVRSVLDIARSQEDAMTNGASYLTQLAYNSQFLL